MNLALIGLGSNLGDRTAALDAALAQVVAHPQIELVRRSTAAEYPSVGGPADQSAYLNAAALLRTDLAPHALWSELSRIENQLGRTRDVRWGARTIDLDLLLFGDQVVHTPSLVVPHPRLACRRFVLEPAAEIAAEMVHPTIGWTIERLLNHLQGHPRYVALAGPIGVGKTQLGRQIVAAVPRLGVAVRSVEEPIDDILLEAFYADPAGRAPATELEFLNLRAPLLPRVGDAALSEWIVSDFWFGQALAYGQLWLTLEDREVQRQQYEALAQSITPPKLLVVLDAPPEELRRRIAARGRPYELGLSEGLLNQLRENIDRTAAAFYSGPVLRFSAMQSEAVVDEVVAAMAGMQ